jgi:hypothetical protein
MAMGATCPAHMLQSLRRIVAITPCGPATTMYGNDLHRCVAVLSSLSLPAPPFLPVPDQAVDPFAPPPNFIFTVDHLNALTSRERSMYVPLHIRCPRAAAAQGKVGEQSAAVNSAAAAAVLAAAAAGRANDEEAEDEIGSDDDDSDTNAGSNAAKARSNAKSGAADVLGDHRKVLVLFFGGERHFTWAFKDELLPFLEHQAAKTGGQTWRPDS